MSCIVRKANSGMRKLFSVVNKSYTIDINLELIVWKSVLLSMLTHVFPVWEYADDHLNKLQTFKIKFLGIITKLPRVTSVEFYRL
jgi:hypothetical protein